MKILAPILIFLLINLTVQAQKGIIVNHNHTDLSKIPDEWIEAAKQNLKIRYFRRSHGSHIDTGGMNAIRSYSDEYEAKYAYSKTGGNGTLMLSVPSPWLSLDSYIPLTHIPINWVDTTRKYLDNPINSQINVLMWAWSSNFYRFDANQYVSDMEILISEYGPNGSRIQDGTRTVPVIFVFQTACGKSERERIENNDTLYPNRLVYEGNMIIRKHCIANNRILFDFNDLECWDPDGNYYGDGNPDKSYTDLRMLNDDLAYISDSTHVSVHNYYGQPMGNWGIEWMGKNPDSELTQLSADSVCVMCYHSMGIYAGEIKDNARLHCVLKGKAAWWLWARLAGWQDKFLTIGSPTNLNELNLNEAIINLTLINELFTDTILDSSNFVLTGAPIGTDIQSVTYIDSIHANLTLSFDGTDFDNNYEQFGIRILAPELSQSDNLTSNSISIEAIIESNFDQTTWTGSASSEWDNPENWTEGIPHAAIDAVIPVQPFNQPVINCDAEVNQLIIESGSGLIISPLKSLTVNANLYINGNLKLESDETGNACLINKDSIFYGQSCDVQTELYLSGWKFHHVSSPTNLTHTDRFKIDPNAPQINPNFYYWNESNTSAIWTDGWTPINGYMDIMKGYTVFYDRNPTIIFDRNISGNFNTGDISLNLTYTGIGDESSPINRGWNFVGNPYPAYLDWDNSGWTKTNIHNSIYFWNGTNYSYYVSDGEGQDNGIGINNGTNIIPPMQGYFVKVAGDDNFDYTGTLITPESARTTISHPYYKNGENSETNIIRLLVSGMENTDETAIRFLANSSSGFDPMYDAYKLFPDSAYGVPQIYSIISGDIPSSINSLPTLYNNEQIVLGFKSFIPGQYTISSNKIKLKDNLKLWFVDMLAKKVIRFNQLNYTFYALPGQLEHRFKIICSKNHPHKKKDLVNSPKVEIYAVQKEIYIKSETTKAIIGDIEIINMSGKIVYRIKNTCDNFLRIPLNDFFPGTYIVRIINEFGISSVKVFLGNN